MTTWLRGARCTDPEEMPEKEARPPAQNRHGGAPRGERVPPDARRASQARIVAPDSATTDILRLSALRSPLMGRMEKRKAKPGRRNAPRERRRLGGKESCSPDGAKRNPGFVPRGTTAPHSASL